MPSPEQVARHEAAHALLATALQVPFDWVSVEPQTIRTREPHPVTGQPGVRTATLNGGCHLLPQAFNRQLPLLPSPRAASMVNAYAIVCAAGLAADRSMALDSIHSAADRTDLVTAALVLHLGEVGKREAVALRDGQLTISKEIMVEANEDPQIAAWIETRVHEADRILQHQRVAWD